MTHTETRRSHFRCFRYFALLLVLAVPAVLGACAASNPTDPMGTPPPTIVRAPGEAVYIRYCNVCHPGGGRGAGPSIKGTRLSGGELREIIRHGKRQMPGFGPSNIPDEELDDLVQYVLALR